MVVTDAPYSSVTWPITPAVGGESISPSGSEAVRDTTERATIEFVQTTTYARRSSLLRIDRMPNVLLNDFKRQWAEIQPDAELVFRNVGESGCYVLGNRVNRFEEALARYWGLSYCVGVASGMDAIEIALRSAGLRKGDKVLTTPLSAFATTLAVIRAGGTPLFADVDESGLLDLDLCEDRLRRDGTIRFLAPVHLYGQSVNIDKLRRLRDKYSLLIVGRLCPVYWS